MPHRGMNGAGGSFSGSGEGPRGGGGVPVPLAIAKSWRPYGGAAAEAGGTAIYRHEAAAPEPGIGGELMSSALVSGPPEQVLAALTHPDSPTGLLGPAASTTVLEEGPGGIVLAIELQPAPGSAAALVCAPRCAVVRVSRRRLPDGITLVLFCSLPRREARRLLAAARGGPADGGGGGGSAGGSGGGGGGPAGSLLRGAAALLWQPVLVEVHGGFSVVGLPPAGPGADGGGGDAGRHCGESMVTGIFRADLGGALSGAGAARSAADRGWLGALAGAFVDRMLLAVPLAKREVESGRARVYQAAAAAAAAAGMVPPRRRPAAGVAHSAPGALTPRGGGSGLRAAAPPPSPCGSWGGAVARASSAGGAAVGTVVSGICTLIRRASSAAVGDGTSGGGAAPAAAAAAAAAHGGEAGARTGLDPRMWRELHRNGAAAPFRVRGPRYLQDRAKVAAGPPEFQLAAVEIATTPTAVHHLSRFLPSVRCSGAPFTFVVNMMVPSAHEVLHVVMIFRSSGWHPDMLAGHPTDGWRPFHYALKRFLAADDTERSNMFKMIPHVERGSPPCATPNAPIPPSPRRWVLKQTVGTTPVIMGRKLSTTYHVTDRYVEVDIDVSSCKTAGYIVGMVRGVTTSLTVDLAYLLEGQRAEELPESLIGAVRFDGIDLSLGGPLDTSRELPMAPRGGGGGGGAKGAAAAGQARGGVPRRGGGARPEQ
ncbi:hypothetical protein Rsub_00387 [Raphidocelis subcapitata]|uniref:Protein ENHANCED DISEASE RESISTANCE 2 C-terminal domain-containing protein n=1 Tax=Raphidocelis subcapitata TaxID=307507 RepID=A0A2V0NK69_9CHLO|nr:hypothetical protein Rsub_00387 [Raphidocelis subcapitata]|eukprot:GBF87676.1 hypothetical protein Rsub_00387 [Raphidocelis subcapitata]